VALNIQPTTTDELMPPDNSETQPAETSSPEKATTVAETIPVSSLILDYLEREREILEDEYDKLIVVSDSDDVGKLLAMTEAFNTLLKKLDVDCLKLGKRTLPEHLLINTPTQSYAIGFLQVSDMAFPARIKSFNELVVSNPEIDFSLFRDARETIITGKVGNAEIDRLNNTPNGKFIYMEKEDRLTFELIYKLIVDIQNRDFEVDLQPALKTLASIMSHYWLIKIFKKAEKV